MSAFSPSYAQMLAATDPVQVVEAAKTEASGGNAPGLRGFQMPPEWSPHARTWLSFPHHGTDFPGKRSSVILAFAEMARVITQSERVGLLVGDAREAERAAQIFGDAGVDLSKLDVFEVPTNRSWNRDSMPIWVSNQGEKLAVKFRFDGWARYRDHKKDDAAGVWVATHQSDARYFPRDTDGTRYVLEGGSIDIDEYGTLLTTSECLLRSPRARFRGSTAEQVEAILAATLGAKQVIWLPDGIVGDDTSGHVDDFARFAPAGRVVICQESKKTDANFEALRAAKEVLEKATNARGDALEVVDLPMPQAVYYRGDRLPASYANYYIANSAVLVPVFNDVNDREALSIIADLYPDRPVVGIYARDLVVGLGTLHCSTMQEPL